MNQSSYDSIIIGGGVVGAAAAHHLARSGAKTLLIDKHDVGRATDAGAGIIGPETSGVTLPSAWFDFAVHAGSYYPTLIEQLNEAQAGNTGYQVCGELTVAADEDELDLYEGKRQIVFERQRQRGLPSAEDLHEVSPQEARELFPALKTVLRAFYSRTVARVDGRMLTAAMLNAVKQKLTIQPERVDSLIIESGRVKGVNVQGSAIYAGNVIIAGGAWSSTFGAQLGCDIPVEPQRGQIIHLHLEGTDTNHWAVVVPFHGHYIVCWENGRVVVGATRETGSGFVPITSAAGVHEVLGEALRVAPGLSTASLGEIRVGLRPRTADNMPVLGGVPNVEGVYLCTGHGASGLMLGPFSGKLAGDWAMGKASEVDISTFHVSRWTQDN
jgi:D-amino-acid dehydrogenase